MLLASDFHVFMPLCICGCPSTVNGIRKAQHITLTFGHKFWTARYVTTTKSSPTIACVSKCGKESLSPCYESLAERLSIGLGTRCLWLVSRDTLDDIVDLMRTKICAFCSVTRMRSLRNSLPLYLLSTNIVACSQGLGYRQLYEWLDLICLGDYARA